MKKKIGSLGDSVTLTKVLQNMSVVVLPVFIHSGPAADFYLRSIVRRHDGRLHSHLQHTPRNWIHYAFEMLLCFSNKLNYFICFECFGLLYNTNILNLGMRVLVFVFYNFCHRTMEHNAIHLIYKKIVRFKFRNGCDEP